MSKDTSGAAYPHNIPIGRSGDIFYSGLTKREYFAAMALQGELTGNVSILDINHVATRCVMIADALINALKE
jgi:hypothetical protein